MAMRRLRAVHEVVARAGAVGALFIYASTLSRRCGHHWWLAMPRTLRCRATLYLSIVRAGCGVVVPVRASESSPVQLLVYLFGEVLSLWSLLRAQGNRLVMSTKLREVPPPPTLPPSHRRYSRVRSQQS